MTVSANGKGQNNQKRRIWIGVVVLLFLFAAAAAWKWTPLADLIDINRLSGWAASLRNSPTRYLYLLGAYIIGSMAPKVRTFAKAARDHWGIENRLHWSLDVTFAEDRSRVRRDHGPENLAMLRRLPVVPSCEEDVVRLLCA